MASSCCCGKLRQLGSKLGGRCAATLEQRGKLGSPTQRSLKLMRERGFYAEVVEHWNQWARKRKDLFGFIDVLCLGDTGDLVGVQSTSASNISARVRKITDSPFPSSADWRIVLSEPAMAAIFCTTSPLSPSSAS